MTLCVVNPGKLSKVGGYFLLIFFFGFAFLIGCQGSQLTEEAEGDPVKTSSPLDELARNNFNEELEALNSEIETLNTTIANALCRVTEMHTGADEIEMVAGDSSVIDAEIKELEETQRNIDWGDSKEPPAEYTAIDEQIAAKLEEKRNIPLVEQDNTVYWEGYGGGCKRTSYNTKGGEHKLGGTPFRKNYAGIGHLYDPVRDAFYSESPYPSWTLNESTCYWEAPTPMPETGDAWWWKEDTAEWVDYPYTSPISPQPFPSWTYDGLKWVPPVEKPEEGCYMWIESELNWVNC